MNENTNESGTGLLFGLFGKSRINEPFLHSFEIKEEQLVFIGGSKYDPIPFKLIESMSYQPRDDDWQEISIKIMQKGTLNYYLNSDVERLQIAVDKVNYHLEPSQPICKFILAAKQGSLSGKD
jgi:hypothetical protein